MTLNNATLIYNRHCINCERGLELTIRLVGANAIVIQPSAGSGYSGINKYLSFEPLTIIGTGKLTISGALDGVYSDGALTVQDATLEIISDRQNSTGFTIGGDTHISGKSNVTIVVDYSAISCQGDVTVSDGSKLDLTTAGKITTSKFCVRFSNELVVNDGCKLTIKGSSTDGISGGGIVKLYSPEVSVSAQNSAISASGITLGNGIAIATPAGGKISDDGVRIVDADGNVAKDVTLTKGITINATASSKEAGTVEGAGCYAPGAGTTVKLKAIPNEGYEFVNWTEGTQIVSDKAAYEFSLQDERTLVANFRKKKFTITFVNEDGTVG